MGLQNPLLWKKTVNEEEVIFKCIHATSVGGDLCSSKNEFPAKMTPNLNVISRAIGMKTGGPMVMENRDC